jgi:hypothetical protein
MGSRVCIRLRGDLINVVEISDPNKQQKGKEKWKKENNS